jgi:hypothetical protein
LESQLPFVQLAHAAPNRPHCIDVCAKNCTHRTPAQHPSQVGGSHAHAPLLQRSPGAQASPPHVHWPRMHRLANRWSHVAPAQAKSPPSVGIAQLPRMHATPGGQGAQLAPLKPHASFVPPDSHSPASLQQPKHVVAHVCGAGEEQAKSTTTTAEAPRVTQAPF